MKLKTKALWLAVVMAASQSCFAVPSSGATTASSASKSGYNNDVNALNTQIQQINQELTTKQQQKQQLDKALRNSQGAISKAAELLRQLKAKRDADLQQLQQLQVTIPQMTDATNQAKTQVAKSIATIYQQLKQFDNQQQSVLSGNDSLETERMQVYMTKVLKVQSEKYNQLNAKLAQLQILNSKLQNEVDRLSARLGETSKQHDTLLTGLTKTQQQAQDVQQQIARDRAKLSDLKQKQARLNRLLKQIAEQERKQKAQQQALLRKQQQQANAASAKANAASKSGVPVIVPKSADNNTVQTTGKKVQPAIIDNSVEDNSPFMARKLVKPVNGTISVGFGQMRDSVRNNGVLLTVANNTPIYAVSNGVVLFSGELPGFGQIVVIDNGDNYTSVYSGILASVKKGARVTSGQQIASSGTASNQPMSGVYFELRHLGKPVNPNALF
ncbi:MAG: hypothetical protein EKK57_06700 [Proteobacteria bacterium]|nr:MAG: hypothetical protein EKK57_06700 [Pseudomonadota bacterium]